MGFLESIDTGLSDLVGQWNGYSTCLVTLLVTVITYRVMSSREADVHPMLLVRQSVAAPVRNEGESAVYRCQALPHGMPLNGGLNVRDTGASKWSQGRDGDLRDVWRRAVSGTDAGAKGRLLTVLGSEKVVEHRLDDVTRQIKIIGRHLSDSGSIKVAVYLPNSLELMVTLLACSFYPNLTTVLIPFDVTSEELVSMLKRSAVDTVVAATGEFPLEDVVDAYPSLRQLVWVVDEGSSHMDWNEAPDGMKGNLELATWQDIVDEARDSVDGDLPALESEFNPQDIVTLWQRKPGQPEEMIRFTQANLAAGIAGQIAALPTRERLDASDLFLPADPLSNIHTLILTLAALYSNASVAFNSVAGRSPHLALATQGIAPTVLVASAGSLLEVHRESMSKLGQGLGRLSHRLSTRNLTEDGVLVGFNPLVAFGAAARAAIGTTPARLRLVYVADRAGTDTPPLSSSVLSDLRVFTGARIIYALAAARVAGSVSQTAYFDYRVDPNGTSHFGAPTTSVEIYLKDKGVHKTTDDCVEGEIVARGPCVSGAEVELGVVGKILDDGTLAYV
ncbi:hypothetical protein DCS_02617 [Drechmeria coniospora]|uniref:AMP-dependent synthetase/ligase domain-containing protein n=1 Tax=Drechmeria coniospora TaxID=98403 RepID=A0A151GWI4_DRECN|nr:hypothetical protein DCS_02617 [Drechmeria coniospora]KYK61475.1 hypothetical protein DCS_02617 [Drechmeria coniospora]